VLLSGQTSCQMFKTELMASFIPKTDLLMLWEPLEYYDPRSERLFVVPVGFTTDGASIPQSLWHIFGHPYSKEVREAAVIHDYLYANLKELSVIREDADQILYDAAREIGMSYPKAQSFFIAVRAFGGSHTKGD